MNALRLSLLFISDAACNCFVKGWIQCNTSVLYWKMLHYQLRMTRPWGTKSIPTAALRPVCIHAIADWLPAGWSCKHLEASADGNVMKWQSKSKPSWHSQKAHCIKIILDHVITSMAVPWENSTSAANESRQILQILIVKRFWTLRAVLSNYVQGDTLCYLFDLFSAGCDPWALCCSKALGDGDGAWEDLSWSKEGLDPHFPNQLFCALLPVFPTASCNPGGSKTAEAVATTLVRLHDFRSSSSLGSFFLSLDAFLESLLFSPPSVSLSLSFLSWRPMLLS